MDIFQAVFCCFPCKDDSSYSSINYTDEADSAFKPLLEKQPSNDCSAKPAYSTFDLGAQTNKLDDTVGCVTLALPPPSINPEYCRYVNEKKIADNIVSRLYVAETREALREEFRVQHWTNTLARHILDGLVNAINSGKVMGGAVKQAYDKVAPEVENFVHEHPILTAVVATLIAICILEYLVPWAVAALGFGELGPIEGNDFSCWVLAMESVLTSDRIIRSMVAVTVWRRSIRLFVFLPPEIRNAFRKA